MGEHRHGRQSVLAPSLEDMEAARGEIGGAVKVIGWVAAEAAIMEGADNG